MGDNAVSCMRNARSQWVETLVPFEGNRRSPLKVTVVPFKGNDRYLVEDTQWC